MGEILIFYFFSFLSIFAALGVLLHPNPVLSALHLVASMIGVAGLFFLLQAPFIAAVQIMVYAGAVMVLFLIVVMLFDLKGAPKEDFSIGKIANTFKILFGGILAGLLTTVAFMNMSGTELPQSLLKTVPEYDVLFISKTLFIEYMFVFEVLGVLLLVIPIGTVALSRIRGGTHAR